jgi:hypothetical protein
MIDKREQLLAQMFVVLTAIPGVVNSFRNRGELPEDKRPAIVLLDGTEEVRPPQNVKGGARLLGPIMCSLKPQVFALLVPDGPQNTGKGQELSAFRMQILKAVLTDPTLKALCGTNGSITYDSMSTDMQTGSSMEGQLQINFTLAYVLNPNDF